MRSRVTWRKRIHPSVHNAHTVEMYLVRLALKIKRLTSLQTVFFSSEGDFKSMEEFQEKCFSFFFNHHDNITRSVFK